MMNKAGTTSSNKTGLVLKISLVLFILLATVVYKLNEYFKNEKLQSAEVQVRNKVILIKTSVSSQLAQLKNTLSSYETELNESNINWVQLEPFFAVARAVNTGSDLKIEQLLVRSNTPADRWNKTYLENALLINKATQNNQNLIQLFQDKANNKFLIIRFKIGQGKELVVASFASYFQKFFDIERGESGKSLLVTTENILVAHSESEYIASHTDEVNFLNTKYIFEKEEIVGTNLFAMNYILKSKIAEGLVVPWSILGIVTGFGFILVAILFYSIEPIERKVDYYKRQERAQIYKDTFSDLSNNKFAPNLQNETIKPSKEDKLTENASSCDSDQSINLLIDKDKGTESINSSKRDNRMQNAIAAVIGNEISNLQISDLDVKKTSSKEVAMIDEKAHVMLQEHDNQKLVMSELTSKNNEKSNKEYKESTSGVVFDDNDMDLADIERALSLDDVESIQNDSETESELLKKHLTPQKINISEASKSIGSPNFSMIKKDFMMDSITTQVRRPEKKIEKKTENT